MSPSQATLKQVDETEHVAPTLTAAEINDLLANGQFGDVVAWCGGRIASHPQDFLPYLSLGLLAEIAGDEQRSAEYFAEAIVRNVDCGVGYAHLGRVFRKLGQLQHAVRALQVAIEMGAAGTDARLDIADIFFEMGDHDNARAAYRGVLYRRPDCARSTAMMRLLPPLVARADAPPGWERVHIAIVAPEAFPHWQAFSPTAAAFAQAFDELGAAVTIGCNEYIADGINIIFGAHLIASEEAARAIPANAIIFNLEQLAGFQAGQRPIYGGILNRHTVWDYSARNLEWLQANTSNPNSVAAKLGYAVNLTAVYGRPQQTTDVLFYGSLNDRRAAILEKLRARGLTVKHLFNVYGDALDDELARAKVVLNMHFYEDSIHEIVRTSYLLANRKAVVTECNINTEMDAELQTAMRTAAYDELVDACAALVQSDVTRAELEQRAFATFSQTSQTALLAAAIANTRRA